MKKAIRFYTIPQDDRNDYVECSECGRSIRYIVYINEVAFGRRCAAKELGMASKQVNKKFDRLAMDIEIVKAQVEKGTFFNTAHAATILKGLGIQDFYNGQNALEYGKMVLEAVGA